MLPVCLLETSRHTTGPIVRLPDEDRMSAAAYRVLQYGPFFQFGVWIQAVVFLVGFFTINYIIQGYFYSFPNILFLTPCLLFFIVGLGAIAFSFYTAKRTKRILETSVPAFATVRSIKETTVLGTNRPILAIQYQFVDASGVCRLGTDRNRNARLLSGGINEIVLCDPKNPSSSMLLASLLGKSLVQDEYTGQIIALSEAKNGSENSDDSQQDPVLGVSTKRSDFERTRNRDKGRSPDSVYINGLRFEPVNQGPNSSDERDKAANRTPGTDNQDAASDSPAAIDRLTETPRNISFVAAATMRLTGDQRYPLLLGLFTFMGLIILHLLIQFYTWYSFIPNFCLDWKLAGKGVLVRSEKTGLSEGEDNEDSEAVWRHVFRVETKEGAVFERCCYSTGEKIKIEYRRGVEVPLERSDSFGLWRIQGTRIAAMPPFVNWLSVATSCLFIFCGTLLRYLSVRQGALICQLVRNGTLTRTRLAGLEAVQADQADDSNNSKSAVFYQGLYEFQHDRAGGVQLIEGPVAPMAELLNDPFGVRVLYNPENPSQAIHWNSLAKLYRIDFATQTITGSARTLLLTLLIDGASLIAAVTLAIRLISAVL